MADLNNFLDDSDDESNDSDGDIPITSNNKNDNNDNKMIVDNANNNNFILKAEDLIADQSDNINNKMSIDNNNNNTNIIIKAEDLIAAQAIKEEKERSSLPSAIVDHSTSLSFDLGHLMCYDPSSLDTNQLFKYNTNTKNNNNNIPTMLSQTDYEIRKLKEKYLYDITRSNVQAMVNKLYNLPPVKTGPNDDPGLVVKLPSRRTKLPRSKPIPEAKPMTRWEKFAARKGIRTSKKTKNKLVWDDDEKKWKKKYGYKKANNPADQPIFEHKDNDFDTTDPWTKMDKDKKKRIKINKDNKIRNIKEAFGDRINGTLDLQSVMNHRKNKNKNKNKIGARYIKQQLKYNKLKYGHLNVALRVAQHSTASMGKFDKLNKNEMKPIFKKNNPKSIDYLQTNNNTKIHQFKYGKNSFHSKERNKQNEVLFNIFGKEQNDGFNVQKATRNAQIDIEKKRAFNNRNRKRKWSKRK